jgi:hypothetical protein
MKRAEYLRDENWYGSFYEIAVELGPMGDDALAVQALHALWSQPEVRGPWRERTDFDFRSDVSGITINDVCLYGCLRISDDRDVGCMSHLIREESGADWLDLSVPLGMLEGRFPVSYPLDVAANPWMSDIEERLVPEGPAYVSFFGPHITYGG